MVRVHDMTLFNKLLRELDSGLVDADKGVPFIDVKGTCVKPCVKPKEEPKQQGCTLCQKLGSLYEESKSA